MKNPNHLTLFVLFIVSTMLSSCEAIMGIFKAGMGFGAFAVIAVIMLIIYAVTRIGKNKNA